MKIKQKGKQMYKIIFKKNNKITINLKTLLFLKI